MSRFMPNDVFELDPAPRVEKEERRRPAWLFDLRSWLFLGMGLGGILTVALIASADQSYAGIDGMRAVRASVPQADAPDITRIPFLGGIVSAIHDLPPAFFAPSPDAVGQQVPPSARPAGASPSPARPTPPAAPVAKLPGATPPPPASSDPTATPGMRATPGPSTAPDLSAAPAPTASPAPTATPTPAPNVAITTDRGASAIVNLAGLVPGDTMVRTITVQNSGSLAFRYTVSATQTASTRLWTDTTDGLQLIVSTSGGTVLYAGPLSGLGYLAGPTTLAPGTSELLRYRIAFPASASNTFQGLIQDLTLVFDAIEFP
jgi:hypothetical protein